MLAIVIGGSGGIGRALVEQLRVDPEITCVVATGLKSLSDPSNTTDSPTEQSSATHEAALDWYKLDASREHEVRAFGVYLTEYLAEKLPGTNIRYVINCVGMLYDSQLQPEKSIRDFSALSLQTAVATNTLPTLLLARYLAPLLKTDLKADRNTDQMATTIFATLSARVGSITDNRLGGWYSYRMSKAALNMAIRTLSIEWRRSHRTMCAVALHPGTTDTSLSAPFQRNVPQGQLFSRQQTAQLLITVMRALQPADTGKFLAYDGSEIPW